jgi:hypothetical protein
LLNALGRSGQPFLQIGPTVAFGTSTVVIRGNTPRQLSCISTNTIPSMADLPVRWIDYSALDIIVASRQDLQTLVEKHPAQWAAIRRWVSAGGNLWIYGVGQVKPQQQIAQWNLDVDRPWLHLGDVNGWIPFATPDDLSPWKHLPEPLHGWSAPDPFAQNSTPNQYGYGGVPQPYPQPAPNTFSVDPGLDDSTVAMRAPKDQRTLFVIRRFGQGLVVAIPDVDPSNNSFFRWELLFNNVGAEHWHWSLRHGVNFSGQNENYWNFLIPGVGAAPVTAFQVLITLFVLAIGPVNFYVLRRWHKLNLLLITVPASAAVVTAALLSYAILSDGFGVRARTRSFTEIDQRTGEATCLGRITYYAGLTPSKGLSFSGDITVYPLNEQPQMHQFDPGQARRLAWVYEGDDDRVGTQHLESGWLQSRIQTQLLTFRARKTDARLDIAAESGRATSTTNQLGVPISILLVRDSQGNYSFCNELDSGASTQLDPLPEENLAILIALNRDKALQAPAGVELSGSHAIFGIRRRSFGRRFNSMGGGISGMEETSMLERTLSDALAHAVERDLPKRSYIAVVDRSPEFELGLDSATEESSLHVIYGRW